MSQRERERATNCNCGTIPAFSAVESGVCGEAGFMVDGVEVDEEGEGPGLGEGRE